VGDGLTFRRSWNTGANGKGVSPKIRGAICGTSEEMNPRVDTKVIPDPLRNAVEWVGNKLCATVALQPESAELRLEQ
jgi:hypothetical protein